jgi:hypothetical protein
VAGRVVSSAVSIVYDRTVGQKTIASGGRENEQRLFKPFAMPATSARR